MKAASVGALAASLWVPLVSHSAFADDATVCATPGKILKPVAPSHTLPPYPRQSVRQQQQGRVIALAAIGTDGVPAEVTVITSSGSQRLDDAATQHIKTHWRWEPPTEGCKPASAEAKIVVDWHIFSGFPPQAKAGINMRPEYYPPGATGRFEMGDTYLELSLGDGGMVKDGRVVFSSGFPDLDEKALAVVKGTNGAFAGQPVGTEVVLVRWSLPPEQSAGVELVRVSVSIVEYPDSGMRP